MALFENEYEDMNNTVKNTANKKRKRSKGRQKIEIKQIQKPDQRQVTFSKRRTGLFKKAGELSVLCGAEVAIIVFSEGSKLYTFAHPNVDIVVERYLNGRYGNDTEGTIMMHHCSGASNAFHFDIDMNRLNKCYLDAARELEEERRKGKRASEGMEGFRRGDGVCLWDEVTEGMCLEELEEYLKAMHEMKAKMVDQLEQALIKEEAQLKDAIVLARDGSI